MGSSPVIAGVHIVSKRLRSGPAWYVYAWRGGPQVLKATGPRKPRLDKATLQAIVAAQEKRSQPEGNSLRLLIREWRSLDPGRPSSPEWSALADTTKKTWGSALDRIEEKWGEVPLKLFNDPRMKAKIVQWRDSRANTPRAADMGVVVLKALLKFGLLRGKVLTNVATDIPRLYRGGDRSEIIWTDDDVSTFVAKAEELGSLAVADALRLAVQTGLRRNDLVTLTWDQVQDSAISKKALKRSKGRRRFATIPRLASLNALLDELKSRHRAEGVRHVIVDQVGRPWSPDRLTKAFNRVRDAAEISHIDEDTGEARRKHLHDARGTFATKLMTTTDVRDQELADMMGWSPEKVSAIRRVYVDQTVLNVAIATRLRGAV